MKRILKSFKWFFERNPRPFGIAEVMLDKTGKPYDVRIVYVNEAIASSMNAKPLELKNKRLYKTWPNSDNTWLDSFYSAAYENKAAEFEGISVMHRAFQKVTLFPIKEGYCGFELQDVKTGLVYSHLTMTSVSAGMFFYEVRSRVLMLTDPARETCGLAADYITLDDFVAELFEGESGKRVREGIEVSAFECERVLLEERLKNGRWLRLSLAHEKPEDQFIVGFLEDITSLRVAEAKSARRSRIIESLSAEYYALYVVALDADTITPYLLRDKNYTIRSDQDGVSAPYSEWLKRYCELHVADEDRQEVLNQFDRNSLLKRFSEHNEGFSFSFRRKFDVGEHYVELSLTKMEDTDNELVLAARNINEEVKKQISQKEALQSALVLAQHASEAKTTFLTNISHDFRTPLNSIMGFTNLALSHLDDTERVRDSLEKIITSSEHLLDLINDVLDVSRIESGKIVLNEEPLNLTNLISDVESTFLLQASERDLSFTVDTSRLRHPYVLGDQVRIKQILVNTVGNAFKYTENGGAINVSAFEGPSTQNELSMFEIVVRDNGYGMSEDFIPLIFQPFERESTGAVPASEGTGLGMTITKNLVDLMGGSISVRSKKGKGSEFTILLPLRLDKHTGLEGENVELLESDKSALTQRFDGFRILVVDDDELSREMMDGILRDFGFEVVLASDGDEALCAVTSSEEGYFDAVVMDMRMPKMPGDDAARAIRSLPRKDVSAMPIIASTADAYEEGHRRSREASMTAHITKPLNTRELITVLTECLYPAKP